VGLARCSSEEKALAKAKKDKLTVSIGEFCSKKVLGICLEKKELLPVRLKTGADRSAAGKKRSAAYRFWRRQQS
jgi:hypothetical protein